VRASFQPLRTSTFRLAALFLTIFIASTIIVLAYIYYNTVVLLERQNEETIQSEVLGLADQYRLQNLAGVVDTIRRREAQKANMYYQLATPNGDDIIGNIHSVAIEKLTDDVWIDFQIMPEDINGVAGHTARGYNVGMPNGYHLLVARDVAPLAGYLHFLWPWGWAVAFSSAEIFSAALTASRELAV
jgi:hypothetical protein